jgi:ParB-like nuclease domain
VFPVLDDDELEELAQDIKDNGLQQPLVVAEVDGQTMLIDGRTRRMACLALGMVPDYVLLDGQDPVTYILSANIHRRHMTKGQRVMIVAKICSETKQTLRQISEQNKVALAAIGRARTVLHHAPDLADPVIAGSISLDNAYEEARVRKGRAETYEARFNSLSRHSPFDLHLRETPKHPKT